MTLSSVRSFAVLCAFGACLIPTQSAGQTDPDRTSVEAMRCWRRVSHNAIRIGQPFSMTLTCRVVESELGRAVPDLVGLEPETLDVPPFEVVDGERFTDIIDGPRRLFQYDYTLRLVGEGYFGEDISIPALEINYRIERRLESGAALPGRELVYVLPSESIRVLSLVPEGMPDILGIPLETLGAAEQRRFRADLAMLLAAGLGVVALGVLVVGLVRNRHERVAPDQDRRRPVPEAALARVALGELTSVRDACQARGWTPELAGRALAALRVSAAVVLRRPVAEREAKAAEEARDGELRVRTGVLRPRTHVVSSSVTAVDVTSPELGELQRALTALAAGRYASNDEARATDQLTDALEYGIALTRPLRLRALTPVRRVRDLIASVRG